jgi:CDGSH-type Zn-finger protein/uncharacterized Fe-S cluster protein YjdI
MGVHKYTGHAVEIAYDAKLCIHAAECVRGAPEVFNPQAKPWVAADAASAEKIAQVVRRCPTGALTMKFVANAAAAGAGDVEAEPKNTAAITANGPLYLRGQLTVHAADGTTREMTRMALCRCGASANKPFCDGSHHRNGFQDAGHIAAAPASAQDASLCYGPVAVKPNPNGSVMVEGYLELRTTDGKTFVSESKTWLCRCGASKNKPFCDGSHKAVGFTS